MKDGPPLVDNHVCSDEVVVHVYNDWLLKNLIDEGGQMDFDAWWHTTIAVTGYNKG